MMYNEETMDTVEDLLEIREQILEKLDEMRDIIRDRLHVSYLYNSDETWIRNIHDALGMTHCEDGNLNDLIEDIVEQASKND